MYYTKEQILKIRELDVVKHFNTVLDSQYKRGTTSVQDTALADIYDAATGKKVSRNFNCKSCVFNLYRDAGKLYRETIEFQLKENLKKAREAKANKQKVDNKEDGEG